MAENSTVAAEDAEMPECEGEKVVTMMDVLKEQQDFEDDANAVLGASDEKECTYPKGYIKRQAVYACLTCCGDAKSDEGKRAGLCLACSLSCHENHELVELYTKRNFRCDCGNPKLNSHPCQFTTTKTDVNEDNIYNQNFSGLYCICHRPYPDPERPDDDDEMVQCIICEDWLHADHLEATIPNPEHYAEMICKPCMDKNEFLHDYSEFAVNAIENGDVDVVNESAVRNVLDNTNGEDSKEKDTSSANVDMPATEEKVCDKETDNSNGESTSKKEESSLDTDKETPEEDKVEDTSTVENKNENKDELPSETAATQSNDKEKPAENGDSEEKSEGNSTDKEDPYSSHQEPSENENVETAASTNEEKMDTEKSEPEKPSKNGGYTTTNGVQENNENKRKLSEEDSEEQDAPKKAKVEKCVRPKAVKKVLKGAAFWPSDFRQKLCICSECLSMYKDLAVLYLIDVEDTVTAYETLGKERTDGAASTQYEKGLEALSSLDRIQQINALTEYNKMRDKLLDFLKSFKDRKEVVKEEDIKAFFAGMKPKRESDGVYFCR